jgi:hypothetical protein
MSARSSRGGRSGAGHVADEVNHGVATGDVRIELVERVAAEILEILWTFTATLCRVRSPLSCLR